MTPAALGAALRSWLVDAELRARLRRAALERRESLPEWSSTTSVLAAVLRKRRDERWVVRVSDEWLALREPADAEARSRELVEHLRVGLPRAAAG